MSCEYLCGSTGWSCTHACEYTLLPGMCYDQVYLVWVVRPNTNHGRQVTWDIVYSYRDLEWHVVNRTMREKQTHVYL